MQAALSVMEMLPGISIVRTSTVVYATVNGLHILCLGLLLGAILPLDLGVLHTPGFEWARRENVPLRRLAIVAFAGTALTGFLLFSVRPSDYLQNEAFLLKVIVLSAAGLNATLFSLVRLNPVRKGFAFVSLGLWCGALFAGRFTGFA